MNGARYRRFVALFLGLVAVSTACGTVEVPFDPEDGSGGGGDSAAGGNSDGDLESTGGIGSTDGTGGTQPAGGSGGVGPSTDDGLGASVGYGAMGGFGGVVGDQVFTGTSRIRGIATTATHVYWLEYGTFDELDNYQFDGALARMDLQSGIAETLAEGLEGPIQIAITTEEAFVLLDRSTTSNPDGDKAIGRVSLDGGTLDLVEHEGSYDYPFGMASFADRAYFGVRIDGAWAIREYVPGEEGVEILPYHPGAPGGVGLGLAATGMAADQSHLYFVDVPNSGFYRQDLAGVQDPEALSGADYFTLALEGDRVLTTRGQDPMYLASMPKTGGAWANILKLGKHDECAKLAIVGPRFFAECQQSTGYPYVLTAPWAGGQAMSTYQITNARAWAATEDLLFVGRVNDLFRIELD